MFGNHTQLQLGTNKEGGYNTDGEMKLTTLLCLGQPNPLIIALMPTKDGFARV
jgi:hypothetical protein